MGGQGGTRWLLCLVLLACALQTSSEGIVLADVHRMVRNLGDMLLEQGCTVLGASDGPECARFNRSGFPSPSQVVSAMSDENSANRLFFLDEIEPFKLIDKLIEGDADSQLPSLIADGGIKRTFDEQRGLIDSLVQKLEDIYLNYGGPDPNFSPGSLFNETRSGPKQTNWLATYNADGKFKGRYIKSDSCAFHKPSATESRDSYRVDNDVLRMKEACDQMKENGDRYKDSGLTFQYAATVSGVTMDFPASIRGLAFDNRYEAWFREGVAPAKDIVIVVDGSGSMEASAPCGALKLAEAQIKSIFWSFVTKKDRVQLLIVGDEPVISPCFGNKMVSGHPKHLQALLEWFYLASRKRGGQGALSSGVVEALDLMDAAEDAGDSTGGARFVMVMTDGLEIEDIVGKGLRRYAVKSGKKLPLRGVHVLGVALSKIGKATKAERTPLDAAACAQRGLVWEILQPKDPSSKQTCTVKEIEISVDDGRGSVVVDPNMLLNSTDLPALAAFPFSIPPDKGGLSGMYWQNLRSDIQVANETGYRQVLSAGRPFFDRRADPPKLAGMAKADFLMDDFRHAIRSVDVPALTHISIIKHQDDIGHVLEHTSTPPDYSDYVDVKEKGGDFDSHIVDYEGVNFDEQGVLDAIVQQDEGYKSVERKIIVDHDWSPFRDNNMEHLVRTDITEVTYFWKRVPNTPFTVLVSVPGAPVEGRKMYTPNFRSPEACSQPMSMANVSSIRAASDTCWISTYKDFPLVYHRLDVLSQSTSLPTRLTEPFGGASACFSEHCSYDTSTWLAAPSSFVSDKQYLELPQTIDRIESISKSMLSGPVAAPENMLGGGLRSRALSSLKITSVMEAFWKDVLGVEGAEMNGNPATLNPAKSDVRRDVLQFVFATDAGILRMYPGGRASVPVDYNVRREPYYTRAISHPGDMAVSQPYLPDALNTTFWTVTLSKAIYHTPTENTQQKQKYVFGVAGVHYRFDAFVRRFREATTLRSVFRFGCGDMGTSELADRGLACFLLNENANIILDRKLMQLGEQRPDSLVFDPSLRNFHEEEPFLLEQLYAANAITASVLRYGTTEHVAYNVNQSALEEFSAKKRAAARAVGQPESDLIGIELLKRVNAPGGSSLNSIWFYQVPGTKTYLLVVSGYTQNNQAEAFCGSLSLYCPNTFDPQESKVVTSVCQVPEKSWRAKADGYVYEGPTFHELRRLHQSNARADGYELKCPLTFQLWTIGLLVVGGLLFIVVFVLLMNLLIVRARRRRAALQVSENMSKGRSYMVAESEEAQTQDSGAMPGMEGVKAARILDYKVLAARQWQLAENLSTRDEGDVRELNADIISLKTDANEMFEQLDYLQQRVHKQEQVLPKFQGMRRQASRLSNTLQGMINTVDALKAEGHLRGLDPDLAEDASELKASLAGHALPTGTREALFHRIYHPHLVERKRISSSHEGFGVERQVARGGQASPRAQTSPRHQANGTASHLDDNE